METRHVCPNFNGSSLRWKIGSASTTENERIAGPSRDNKSRATFTSRTPPNGERLGLAVPDDRVLEDGSRKRCKREGCRVVIRARRECREHRSPSSQVDPIVASRGGRGAVERTVADVRLAEPEIAIGKIGCAKDVSANVRVIGPTTVVDRTLHDAALNVHARNPIPKIRIPAAATKVAIIDRERENTPLEHIHHRVRSVIRVEALVRHVATDERIVYERVHLHRWE